MKKTNYKTGLAAEALCRMALRIKGYGIVASRYRGYCGEVDIIAVRGKALALIEVKARPSLDLAAEALSAAQRLRLESAADEFLSRHPGFCKHDMRFDMMLVAPWRWPVHIVNAWQAKR
ncbi:MAG: YraN family protein [Bdellovibrionales bacterium]